jgi:tocopherol cyclase
LAGLTHRAAPPQLTTGGGVRDLPLLGGTEDVALVGVHYKGTFIELVPWRGRVSWDIAPWGSWRVSAASDTHEAEIVATCAPQDGTTLRAPTASGAWLRVWLCVCRARRRGVRVR